MGPRGNTAKLPAQRRRGRVSVLANGKTLPEKAARRGSALRASRAAQAVGSAMLVAATALLAYAFYGEPKGIPGRPLTTTAVVALVAGVAAHLAGRVLQWRADRRV